MVTLAVFSDNKAIYYVNRHAIFLGFHIYMASTCI